MGWFRVGSALRNKSALVRRFRSHRTLCRRRSRCGRLRRLEDTGRDRDDSCTPVVGDGMDARAGGTCQSPTDETPEIGGTSAAAPTGSNLGSTTEWTLAVLLDVEACKSVPYRRRGCIGELSEGQAIQ